MTTQMKNKTLSLLGVGILALIFLVSAVSAAVSFTPVALSSTVQQGKSVTLSFTATTDVPITTISFNAPVTLTLTSGSYSFNTSTVANAIASLAVGAPSTTMSLSINVPETQQPGTYAGKLVLTGDGTHYTLPITIIVTEKPRPEEVKTCILTGDDGNLDLEIKDVKVASGYGEDTEWFPLDNIEVELKVENKGNEKMKNIVVEWGLYNLDTDEFVFQEEESDFDLKDGDDKKILLEFKLDDPEEFQDGGSYAFFVWANGEDAETDPETSTCVSDVEDIEVQIESDFVVVDNVQIEEALDTVACGTTVHLTADVWNIGEDDQDKVSVKLYNKDLKISQTATLEGLDAFEKDEISFEFTVPAGMTEQWYTLEFTAYNEDDEVYQNDYNDDDSVTKFSLKVEGDCALAQATMTASLESGGKAGKPMVVKATITNPGSKLTTYSISAKGYETWASAVSAEPNTLILENQQTGEVLLTLDVNANAVGDNLFNVEVYSEGELVLSQPVSVSVQKAFIPVENGLLTGLIIAVSVVLLVIIIVLIAKAGRKKK